MNFDGLPKSKIDFPVNELNSYYCLTKAFGHSNEPLEDEAQ
jgi:hypothetical protein